MKKIVIKLGAIWLAVVLVASVFFVVVPMNVNAGGDTIPPELEEFDFIPTTIDVSAGPVDVTFTLSITDDLSGFSGGWFGLDSPSGQQNQGGSMGLGNRISGDDKDGTYEVTVTFPQYIESGIWHITILSMRDKVGNLIQPDENDLIAMGFPTELEVISIPEDTTPPELEALDFSPKTIDVSTGPQDVTFTIRITDHLSGFSGGWFGLDSPSGQQNQGGSMGLGNRISGDDKDGTYEVTVTFPQYIESGIWHITILSMRDKVGNLIQPDENDLIAMGFPTELEVISIPEDTTPPELEALDFSPKTIDVSTGPQDVTFTIRITDHLSGFSGGWFGLDSPSGQQNQGGSMGLGNRISGDDKDGTYEVTVTFPQYIESGIWHITILSMRDKVGNLIQPDENDLIAMGFPTELNVNENEPPVANAGPDQTVEQTSYSGAEVTLDGSGSSDPDDDPLTYSWTWEGCSATGVSPTVTFPLGTTTVTLTVDDGELTDTDTVDIFVEDTTPPEITVAGDPIVLWPPNHKYHTIEIYDFVDDVTDICDANVDIDDVIITSVSSDEPEDVKGNGDGNTKDDIVIVDSQTVKLRAERQGKGNGRVYTINFEVTDASDNTATGSFTVSVPHDKKDTAIDDGASAGYIVYP